MLLSEGLSVLSISSTIGGRVQTVFLTVAFDANEVSLVDSGNPGQEDAIIAALRDEGLSIDDLRSIVLTHQDIDHIGSAAALRNASNGRARVYAHPAEVPFIAGQERLLKLSDEAIRRTLSSLPPELRGERRAAIQRNVRNPPKVTVDVQIRDGQILPMPGNPRVVSTPGHTPGHISLLFERSSVLVAGDCLFAEDGDLALPEERICSDFPQAIESIARLTSYDIGTVVCHHGGVVEGDIRERLDNLLSAAGT